VPEAPERRVPPAQTARRLLELSRSEWRRIALGTLFLAIGSAMQLAYPQMIRRILDHAVLAGSAAIIDGAAIAMAAMFVVQGLTLAGRAYCFSVAGERIVSRLRERVYAHLVSQEIAFFDERKTGELTSRLASDATVLQSAVAANVSMVLRNLVASAGGLVLLFYTSPKLTLIMLAVVPPVALGAVIYGKRVSKLARKTQDALAASNQVAEESIAGIRTVRSFAAEEVEAARYTSRVEEAFGIAKQRARAMAVFSGAATIAGYGAVAVVLWYGGRLVLDHAMSVGELTSFVLYTLVVAFSLGTLADLWTDFMRAGGAAARVFELLERQPQIPLRGGESPAVAVGGVALEGVVFAYPTRPDAPVLRGLDLELRPGERVALVGQSGAGKSTVAALVGRQYDPQGGRVLFDGRPLDTLDPGWLRRQVGVVAQEPVLFSTTIGANIRYGRPDASDAEVEAAARAANAHLFVSGFPDGYQTVVGERGVQLSGGQRQRIAIARALLKDPRLLILDEATSALDAESEYLVVEALERLMEGRTTLVIAHRLSTVKSADRVAVLEDGRVVQSGPHAQLVVEEGLYRRLVERQLAG
jgi:ABC transporter fused permease/ATP-binding protein